MKKALRFLRTSLVVAAFAVVAGAGGVWLYRVELAARTAIAILEQRGFGPVDLTVHHVGLHSARASGLSLYGGAVRASSLVLTFDLGDLYVGRARTMEIEGLRTTVDVKDGNTKVGGRTLPASTAPGSSVVPISSITLRDIDVSATFPALAQPVRITGGGRLIDTTLSFELVASMQADRGSVLEVLTAGKHDIERGAGTASVTMRTLKFHANSKQPADLFPALTGILPRLDGAARAAGLVSWTGDTIVPDLSVHVEDIAFETPQAKVSGLRADLHVTSLTPLATTGRQTLTATVKPGGLPAAPLSLQFELKAKPAVHVEALTYDFAGGRITASPFTIDPAHPDFATRLHFAGVELEQAFRLLNVDGVAGAGRMEGDVALRMHGGKISIDDSRLAASGPGELDINNGWLLDRVGGADPTVRDALLTLGDFHYEVLTIEFVRGEGGTGSLLLRLQGQNPTASALKGQKINFNIRLESNFDRLTELALHSVKTVNELLRQR
jgi:hypothetical protein